MAMVCHVMALDQGLNLEHDTLEHMGYDDGTATMLVVKGGVVFALDVSPAVQPGSPEQLKWTYVLAEGPPVLRLRLTLDGGLLAIQRGPTLLEFVDVASGNMFVHGSERGRGEILAFFFTELAGSELVLVTPHGLELHTWVARRQGLRFRERIKLPVQWAMYTHETRMVLLGTGSAGASYIRAFQFVSSGVVVLPPFTAGAATNAAALEATAAPLPAAPSIAAAAATPAMDVPAEDVRLVKMYGRVYCAHINCQTSKLELYRFYTDTVMLQHTYELFSSKVDLCVVDNVLVVQHLDSAVAVLFDVAARTQQPVANPLPLGIQPAWHASIRSSGSGGSAPSAGLASGSSSVFGGVSAGAGMVRSSSSSVMQQWSCLPSGLVVDRQHQAVYRLALDLKAVAESCSDPAILIGFLQRRRPPALPGPGAAEAAGAAACQPKALILSVVRNALQERLPMPTLRAIFDDLSSGYAQALGRSPGGAIPVPQLVSADELAVQLFQWLHDEEVVDAPYLQAALTEYKAAAVAAGISLPVALQKLSLEVLLQQSQLNQVPQFLYSQAATTPPEVTAGLLAAGSGGGGPSSGGSHCSEQLALDVLARAMLAAASAGGSAAADVHAAEDYVAELVKRGEVLTAAKVMRHYRVLKPSAKELLTAAGKLGDGAQFAAIYRLFKEELLRTWPKHELAASKLLGVPVAPQATAA